MVPPQCGGTGIAAGAVMTGEVSAMPPAMTSGCFVSNCLYDV